ncbi:MAG: antibiotic biosynthesis monooxygenase [Anaerolineae bacterium]
MYAQITFIKLGQGTINELRILIRDEYIPALTRRSGFLSAHLLEQVDDPDMAQLITFWESQESLENWRHTNMLQGSDQSIAARVPGLRIERQGYIVRVSSEQELARV